MQNVHNIEGAWAYRCFPGLGELQTVMTLG